MSTATSPAQPNSKCIAPQYSAPPPAWELAAVEDTSKIDPDFRNRLRAHGIQWPDENPEVVPSEPPAPNPKAVRITGELVKAHQAGAITDPDDSATSTLAVAIHLFDASVAE